MKDNLDRLQGARRAAERKVRKKLRDIVGKKEGSQSISPEILKGVSVLEFPDIGFLVDNGRYPLFVSEKTLERTRSLVSSLGDREQHASLVDDILTVATLVHYHDAAEAWKKQNPERRVVTSGIGMGNLAALEASGVINLREAAAIALQVNRAVGKIRRVNPGIYLSAMIRADAETQENEQLTSANRIRLVQEIQGIAGGYGLEALYRGRGGYEFIASLSISERDQEWMLSDVKKELEPYDAFVLTKINRVMSRRSDQMHGLEELVLQTAGVTPFLVDSNQILLSEEGFPQTSRAAVESLFSWAGKQFDIGVRRSNLRDLKVRTTVNMGTMEEYKESRGIPLGRTLKVGGVVILAAAAATGAALGAKAAVDKLKK